MKDIYMQFSGSDIKGESRDAGDGKLTNAIEIESWSHLIRQPKSATVSTAGGHSSERVEHGDMIFTKDMDATSPKLYQACSIGTVFATVMIKFFRANASTANSAQNNKRVNYLTIELRNAIISMVAPSVAAEGIPTETFQLKYSAVKWTYNEVKPDGSAGQTNVPGAWNLATNTTTV